MGVGYIGIYRGIWGYIGVYRGILGLGLYGLCCASVWATRAHNRQGSLSTSLNSGLEFRGVHGGQPLNLFPQPRNGECFLGLYTLCDFTVSGFVLRALISEIVV